MPSKQIDLHIGQITPENAEILVWLDNSLSNKLRYQQILHGVIENENLQMRLLTYPRDQIENGWYKLGISQTNSQLNWKQFIRDCRTFGD